MHKLKNGNFTFIGLKFEIMVNNVIVVIQNVLFPFYTFFNTDGLIKI